MAPGSLPPPEGARAAQPENGQAEGAEEDAARCPRLHPAQILGRLSCQRTEAPNAPPRPCVPRLPAAHTSRPALYHDPGRRAALGAVRPTAFANADPFPPLGFWPRTRPRRPEAGTRPLTSRSGTRPLSSEAARARVGPSMRVASLPASPVPSDPWSWLRARPPALAVSPFAPGAPGLSWRWRACQHRPLQGRRRRRPSSGQAVISKELGVIVPSGRGPPRHGTLAPAALRSLPRGLLGGSLWLALVAPQHCERLRAPGLGPSVE